MFTQHDYIMDTAREKLAGILVPVGVGGLLGAGAGLANAYLSSTDDNPASGSDYLDDALIFGLAGAGIGGLYGGLRNLLGSKASQTGSTSQNAFSDSWPIASSPEASQTGNTSQNAFSDSWPIASSPKASQTGSTSQNESLNSFRDLLSITSNPRAGQIGDKKRAIDDVLAKYTTDVFKADHDARYLNKQPNPDTRHINKPQDQEVNNFDDLMRILGENLKQRGWE